MRREKKDRPLSELESAIGYRFRDHRLLETALMHKSYVNEHPEEEITSNERLEFLGDAVLNLAVSHFLMDAHPLESEGILSRWRAALVNEKWLADKARAMHLGRHLKLGRGEERTKGRQKSSLLADAYEALLAAIYLDGGVDQAFQVIRRQFLDEVVGRSIESSEDFKSRLQEYTQSAWRLTPNYILVGEEGPDHDKRFHVEIDLGGDLRAFGHGKSKKDAEQSAARSMLEHLQTAARGSAALSGDRRK